MEVGGGEAATYLLYDMLALLDRTPVLSFPMSEILPTLQSGPDDKMT